MKKLLNTLYITSENKYLSLDGENVVIKEEGTELGRMPLHNLEMIVTFSRAGRLSALFPNATHVAPLVGAWIEIMIVGNCVTASVRRSSCRSVDCIPNRKGRTFSYVVN